MVSIGQRLSQAALFAGGPFFCYPLKPQLNTLYGDSYTVAYRHFRRDHHGAANLLCHLVCLCFQVLGNFALLHTLDAALPAIQPGAVLGFPCPLLSTAALLSWVVALVPSGAPPVCRLLSLAALWGAYCAAPVVAANRTLLEPCVIAAFVAAMALGDGARGLGLHGFEWGKRGGVVIAAALLCVWHFAWAAAQPKIAGALAAHAHEAALGMVALMLAVAFVLRNPLVPIVFLGAIGCRALSFATGSAALYFWGCAFSASLCQGVSHAMTGERATLINLEDEGEHGAKLSFEWAHVTFFPDLLFHSLHQSFTGQRAKLS